MSKAPLFVRSKYDELLLLGAEVLTVDVECLELAKRYEEHGVLGARHRSDMLHIALATIARVSALVSWDFRHVVRMDRIRRISGVNLACGYTLLPIHSPREVTTDDESEAHPDQ